MTEKRGSLKRCEYHYSCVRATLLVKVYMESMKKQFCYISEAKLVRENGVPDQEYDNKLELVAKEVILSG